MATPTLPQAAIYVCARLLLRPCVLVPKTGWGGLRAPLPSERSIERPALQNGADVAAKWRRRLARMPRETVGEHHIGEELSGDRVKEEAKREFTTTFLRDGQSVSGSDAQAPVCNPARYGQLAERRPCEARELPLALSPGATRRCPVRRSRATRPSPRNEAFDRRMTAWGHSVNVSPNNG